MLKHRLFSVRKGMYEFIVKAVDEVAIMTVLSQSGIGMGNVHVTPAQPGNSRYAVQLFEVANLIRNRHKIPSKKEPRHAHRPIPKPQGYLHPSLFSPRDVIVQWLRSC